MIAVTWVLGPLWMLTFMECGFCLRRWQAFHPGEAPSLECPDCRVMTPVPVA